MKERVLLILSTALLTTSVSASCAESAPAGLTPQIEKREKLLLQRLSPEQVKSLGRCVALFESIADREDINEAASLLMRMAAKDAHEDMKLIMSEIRTTNRAKQAMRDLTEELNNAIADAKHNQQEGQTGEKPAAVFNAASIAGMDISEAAFFVLCMATKDMDEDIKLIMSEIKATNRAKQAMRDLIEELNKALADAKHNQQEGQTGDKPVALAPSASFTAVPMQTAHFKIDYWKIPPPAPIDISAMPLKQKMDEAKLLKSKLTEFEDLQNKMAANVELNRQRRLEFLRFLEERTRDEGEKPGKGTVQPGKDTKSTRDEMKAE